MNRKIPIYRERTKKEEAMNKRFLLVLAAVLVLFAFGIAGAGQIDGLKSGTGPALPKGLENYVNPGGLGDALIYNYYNARNGMITYFSVVNTGELNGNRVRIRFYEAANVVGHHECGADLTLAAALKSLTSTSV